MITIFTIPKAFEGEFSFIQRKAIDSWFGLDPSPQVILVGNDKGTAEFAKLCGSKHIPEVKTENGVPLFDDALKLVREQAKNDIIAYVGADIILDRHFSDFTRAVEHVKMKEFLMLGQRRDSKTNELYGPSALDYYIFPKNLEFECPSFPIGQFGFDNWLIYKFKEMGIPVIDATEVITAHHQEHTTKPSRKTKMDLSKMATLRDADWVLTREGLKRPPFPRNILAKMTLFYPWRLLLGLKRKLTI